METLIATATINGAVISITKYSDDEYEVNHGVAAMVYDNLPDAKEHWLVSCKDAIKYW